MAHCPPQAKKGKRGKTNGEDKGSDHSEDGDEQLEGWSTDAPAAKVSCRAPLSGGCRDDAASPDRQSRGERVKQLFGV